MRSEDQERLLHYYWRELAYLRRMGAAFAEKYPKVAGRLELGPTESPDPHVERLIESFAFLTGRLQHDLDADFPEIAAELLNLLYPHYLSPVPSMAIARFEPDPKAKLSTGHLLPAGMPVFAHATHARDGRVCRFRTCYPVTLLPLKVAAAGFHPASQFDALPDSSAATVLRLSIEGLGEGEAPLAGVEFERLRFFLHGDRMLVEALYELLFCAAEGVVLVPEGPSREGGPPGRPPDRPPVPLPNDAIQAVGLGAGEAVLPHAPQAHPGYRLLQEYFTFPQKFLFFDVGPLPAHGSTRGFDLLVPLGRMPRGGLHVTRDTFQLGCAPVINLFQRTTEPLRVHQRASEYLLVPDARREAHTEIHTIVSVSGSSDPREASRVYEPFYCFNHRLSGRGQRTFWHSRRRPSGRREVPGTEVLISFVDLDFRPSAPAGETVFAHTLCTNRDLAERLPAGGLLQTDLAAPLARIVLVDKPTREVVPPLGGQALWRLVSHLSLNHLSLAGGEESLEALREILRLYCPADDAGTQKQILGIREMAHRHVVHRIGDEAWRGFCRGSEVTLTFDEEAYVGGGAFLFAAVLNRFFALYAAMNSFTRLVIKSRQREGVWKRWPPMAGEQILL